MNKISKLLLGLDRTPTSSLLYAWGWNSPSGGGALNILGAPSSANTYLPDMVQVQTYNSLGQYESWSMITHNHIAAIGIKGDGSMWAWGKNTWYMLPSSNTSLEVTTPQRLSTNAATWQSVSIGYMHAAAIRTDGTLWTWGYASYGTSGAGNPIFNGASPTQVVTGSWSFVNAGESTTHAIRTDGTLWAWGRNDYGQLGITPNSSNNPSPVQIGTGVSWKYVNSVPGTGTIYAIRSDDTLWVWGQQPSYGSGNNLITTHTSSPVQITAANGQITTFKKVGGVPYGAKAIDTSGQLWAWGYIGDGNNLTSASPVLQSSGPWKDMQIIGSYSSTGPSTLLTKDPDNTLWVQSPDFRGAYTGTEYTTAIPFTTNKYWNYVGISDGLLDYPVSIRTSVLLRDTDNIGYKVGAYNNGNTSTTTYSLIGSVTKVASGDAGYIAANSSYPWPMAAHGMTGSTNVRPQQLKEIVMGFMPRVALGQGNGTGGYANNTWYAFTMDIPTNSSAMKYKFLPAGSNTLPVSWTSVSLGNNYIVGKLANSAIETAGDNTFGQLGFTTPTKSPGSWVRMSVPKTSGSHGVLYAISNTGTLWTWGRAPTNSRTVPPDNKTSTIAANQQRKQAKYPLFGIGQAVGISMYGTAYTTHPWANGYQTISVYSEIDELTQIGSASWSLVTTGTNHTAAISANGQIWAWGNNEVNQVTNITSNTYIFPVLMTTSAPGISWTNAEAGNNFTIAVANTGKMYGAGGSRSALLLRDADTPLSWSMLDTGQRHVLAIGVDGSLWGWGSNEFGQRGDANANVVNTPTLIDNESSWKWVSAKDNNSAAVRGDGAVYVWGQSYTTTPTMISGANSTITRVCVNGQGNVVTSNATHITEIDNNGGYTLFTSNGALATWGSYQPTPSIHTSFILVDSGRVYGIARASDTLSYTPTLTLALRRGISSSNASVTANTLWYWGFNNGQTQRQANSSFAFTSKPTQIGTWEYKYVTRTGNATGIIGYGILANGDMVKVISNTEIDNSVPYVEYDANNSGANGSWATVSSLDGNTIVAIKTNGTMWGVGTPGVGTLGFAANNDGTLRLISNASFNGSGWKDVSVGATHCVAVDISNYVYTWGIDTSNTGILGQGKTDLTAYGTKDNRPTSWTGVLSISDQNALGVSRTELNNTLTFSWGHSQYGLQMPANGVTTSTASVIGTPGSTLRVNALSVAATPYSSHIVTNGNYLWGWGAGGVVGDDTTTARSSPTMIRTPIGSYGWTRVASGGTIGNLPAVYGIQQGRLFAWGSNESGRLGLGLANTEEVRISPTPIGGSSWTQIAAGGGFAVAIRADGTLWSWGNNSVGQLGDGTTTNRNSPVQIGVGISSWTMVSAGYDHAMAVARFAANNYTAVYVWGSNDNGQLGYIPGVSTTTSNNVLTPTIIYTGSSSANSVKQVLAGYKCSSFVSNATPTGGLLYSVGLNNVPNTMLPGDGTTGSTSTTPPVWNYNPALPQVAALPVSTPYTNRNGYFISNTGTLYTWGIGGYMDPSILSSNSWSSNVAYTTLIGNTSLVPVEYGSGGAALISYPMSVWYSTSHLRGTSYSIYGLRVFALPEYSALVSTSNPGGGVYVWGKSYGLPGPSYSNTSIPSPYLLYSASGVLTSAAVKQEYSNTAAQRTPTIALTRAPGDGTYSVVFLGDYNYSNSAYVSANAAAPYVVSTGSGLGVLNSPNSHLTSDIAAYGAGANSEFVRYPGYVFGSAGNTFLHAYNHLSWAANGVPDYSYSSSNTSVNYIIVDNYPYNPYTTSNIQHPIVGTYNRSISNTTYEFIPGVWQSASISSDHTVAIAANGSMYGWGHLQHYQIGSPNTAGVDGVLYTAAPRLMGTNFQDGKVSAGYAYTLAANSIGGLYGCGWERTSLLGQSYYNSIDPPNKYITTIQNLYYTSAKVSSVVAYSYDNGFQQYTANDSAVSFVIEKDNAVVMATGVGWHGANGYPTPTDFTYRSSGYIVPFSNVNFDAVKGLPLLTEMMPGTTWQTQPGKMSVGVNHVAAIDANNKLWTWGRNDHGQLGDGSIITKRSPVQVGTNEWTYVAAGLRNTYAIKSTDGTLWAWGDNASGQVGDGTTVSKSSPVQVGTDTYDVVRVVEDLVVAHSTTSNTWMAWGNVPVAGNTSTPVQVAAGYSALWPYIDYIDQEVRTGQNLPSYVGFYGANSTGGVSAYGYAPTAVPYGIPENYNKTSFVPVDSGYMTSISTPSQVGAGSWSVFSAGRYHTLAIDSSGYLWGWGRNTYGQLGDGTTTNRSSPVQIGTSTWTDVKCGVDSSIAINSDGTLWAWGRNHNRQLGTGDNTNRSAPVQISNANNWVYIANPTNRLSAAIRSSGDGNTGMLDIPNTQNLYIWGGLDNLEGAAAIGNYGPPSAVPSPTIIKRLTSANTPIQIASGEWQLLSKNNGKYYYNENTVTGFILKKRT